MGRHWNIDEMFEIASEGYEKPKVSCPKCGSFKNSRSQWVAYSNVQVIEGKELCPPCAKQHAIRKAEDEIKNPRKDMISQYMTRIWDQHMPIRK